MTAEEIKDFSEDVYEQCVSKKMTFKEFRLFAHYIAMRKQLIGTALHEKAEKGELPNSEKFV